MSQTRTEVLDLLKQFEREVTVFDGAEEAFILALTRDCFGELPQPIDWQRLAKATFAMPLCYGAHRDGRIADVPDWLLRQAKEQYLHQICSNESRIKQIQDLAGLFENSSIKVMFLKGAAELAYSHENADFLGRRYMCDIDVLCAVEDLARVDELLAANGYKLWDLGRQHWAPEQIRDFSLKRYSHYIYNAGTKNYLEVHGYVAVGANRLSFPPDFEKLLLQDCVQADLRGTPVWVPKPEHLIVYSLCHAASRDNNQSLVYLDKFYLDEFAATDCVVSPPVLINKRLELSQLRFIVQLRDLLLRFASELDFPEVAGLCSTVGERELNDMYASVAGYVFGHRFPVVPNASLETIASQRQRYVSRYMLPMLAERIESIIAKRLDQLTSEYIEQQVERIAVTVERRVVHSVTERVLESAKSAMKKQLGYLMPSQRKSPVHNVDDR